ncbi:MAG TPA: flagellar type III secretion system pore protein FliP [Defluviitoga sp.]|nr:flagellar type III secretion system pore protein FliP [Defluviitoga sp.]HOP24881.1 flagellar type III secretion system pore protein FliP [Defluviitoga sp.]HPZ28776.1 flagellar type III secretion system pore protein FliP [Defluviitoga sp.]HQD62881.1 flagellar type III secretion system pore protein FliP [Defluviitoga sp.]
MKKIKKKSRIIKILFVLGIFVSITSLSFTQQTPTPPLIDIQINNNEVPNQLSPTLTILLLVTVLSLAPGFLMLITSFTRIVIVLGFVRQAIGTRQSPPNQVMLALALFLTIMIMFPVFNGVYQKAVIPYNEGEIGYQEALEITKGEFKTFMLTQIVAHKNEDNIYMLSSAMNLNISNVEETPFHILVPAFAISELEIAFKMSILIYLPFIIIDMVVASILLSMGMIMIPPVLISLPFKIMIFVMVNGWDLLVSGLVKSFTGG